MSKRIDDTTEPDDESGQESERPAPGSYYYGDSTGYEVYDPEEDEEEEEDFSSKFQVSSSKPQTPAST